MLNFEGYSIVDKALNITLENPKYTGFFMSAYKIKQDNLITEHAIVHSDRIENLGSCPLVRINSACFTGDIFGDSRCDCNEQLLNAFDLISKESGMVIYHMNHEGRGLGITSKLKVYERMSQHNENTFQAMKKQCASSDLRTYRSAILILKDLKISKLRLISNNPKKISVLMENEIEVVDRISTVTSNKKLKPYLQSKVQEQGHLINIGELDFSTITKNN